MSGWKAILFESYHPNAQTHTHARAHTHTADGLRYLDYRVVAKYYQQSTCNVRWLRVQVLYGHWKTAGHGVACRPQWTDSVFSTNATGFLINEYGTLWIEARGDSHDTLMNPCAVCSFRALFHDTIPLRYLSAASCAVDPSANQLTTSFVLWTHHACGIVTVIYNVFNAVDIASNNSAAAWRPTQTLRTVLHGCS